MGAWGAGAFENDDAMDFLGELDDGGLSLLEEAVAAVSTDLEDYVEVPEAGRAIAAGEVIATLMGKGKAAIPDALSQWTARQSRPSPSLVDLARAAVGRVRRTSELRDVWADAGTLPEWEGAVLDLEARLSTP